MDETPEYFIVEYTYVYHTEEMEEYTVHSFSFGRIVDDEYYQIPMNDGSGEGQSFYAQAGYRDAHKYYASTAMLVKTEKGIIKIAQAVDATVWVMLDAPILINDKQKEQLLQEGRTGYAWGWAKKELFFIKKA